MKKTMSFGGLLNCDRVYPNKRKPDQVNAPITIPIFMKYKTVPLKSMFRKCKQLKERKQTKT